MKNYKYVVGEAIGDGLRYMRSAGCSFTVYVGSFQSDFMNYRMGYGHCRWLKKNMGKGGSFYFYDHCNMYFMSVLPLTELQVAYYACLLYTSQILQLPLYLFPVWHYDSFLYSAGAAC